MAGSAGPATTRATSRSGSFAGGSLRVWCGTLNWVSSAVGPASAASPHAGLPRSAVLPQAAASMISGRRRRMGMGRR